MANTSENLSDKSKSFFHPQIKTQNLLKTNKHLAFLKRSEFLQAATISANNLTTEPGPLRLKCFSLKAKADV